MPEYADIVMSERAPSGRGKVCRRVLASILVTFSFVWPNAANADWPQFRGANSNGVYEADDLPLTWSETDNVAWKTTIPGRGWSSPIIVGDRVFLTTMTRAEGRPEQAKPGLYLGGDRPRVDSVEHTWSVICLSLLDGSEVWRKALHSAVPPTSRHIKNSYASETPVSDGERLYVLFGDIGLFCLTLDGEPLWMKEVTPRKTRSDWGPAASPVVHEDRVYMIYDNEEESFLAAYDKRSGDTIWTVPRDEKSNWSTPFIWTNSLRTEIVTAGSGRNLVYDLNGQLLYQFGGNSGITIATPYAVDGLLYVTSGFVADQQRPVFAVRPGASGDISLADNETSNEWIAWCQKQAAPYNPSTIVYQQQLYVLKDRGIFTAFSATTGEPIFDQVRLPAGKSFSASPWAYRGHIFCLNEFGHTFVIKAGPKFELAAINRLPSTDLCMATPAISKGRLIIRTGEAIYCFAATDNDVKEPVGRIR